MHRVLQKKYHIKQKKYFDKDLILYKDYNENLNSWRLSYIRRIKKELLGKKYNGKSLIDIGAGSGYVAVEMAKLGLKVYACDISSTAIKNLKSFKKLFSLKNFHILKCPAEKITLPDRSVDYIVANAILEHIKEEEETIQEWIRILKPEGKIFIVVPLKFRFIWPFFWPVNYVNDKLLGHLRRYDLIDLKRKFNLKTKKVYYTGHFIKMIWLLLSRILIMGIRKNLKLDDYFEKVDTKRERVKYGASNITVIFQKNAS